jgi:methylthioxylose transferase
LYSPSRSGGAQDHLERPPEPAVQDSERQQVSSASSAHRAEVPKRKTRSRADDTREDRIGGARVKWPRALSRYPSSQYEIGIRSKRLRHVRQIGRVERCITIHEAHDVIRGRLETGKTCGSEATPLLPNNASAHRICDVSRSIGRPVVHDDRMEARWHTSEDPRKRRRFVQHGEDHIRHIATVTISTARRRLKVITDFETNQHLDAFSCYPHLGSDVMDVGAVDHLRRDRSREWGYLLVPVAITALVIVTSVWGRALLAAGVDVRLDAPPLFGTLDPQIDGFTTIVVAVALVGILVLRQFAILSWKHLTLAAFVLSLLWGIGVAFADGPDGLLGSLETRHDYLAVVAEIDSGSSFLQGFTDDIGSYPVHVQGHPPALPLTLHVLDRFGLALPWFVAALFITVGASSGIAVLISIRDLAGEEAARRAAPFVVFAPAALTAVTSADGLFMATIAWATCALIVASGRSGRAAVPLAVIGGGLAGISLFLTYGAVPALLVGPVVALYRRRFSVLVISGAVVSGITLAFAAAGFWWWDGLEATLERYSAGVGGTRPAAYFAVANVAVLALLLGPAAVAGAARMRDRRLWLLVGPALAGVLLANASGLSRGEVERIWLPFMPWLMVATAALVKSRKAWFSAQVSLAVGLAIVVRSPW